MEETPEPRHASRIAQAKDFLRSLFSAPSRLDEIVPFFAPSAALPYLPSAEQTLNLRQKLLSVAAVIGLGSLFWIDWRATSYVFIALVTAFYLAHLIFMLFLVAKSFAYEHEVTITSAEVALLADDKLPRYTILCPLYKEWRVLPQFLAAIGQIDWPKNKLDAVLLLEEDDAESLRAIERLALPPFFRVIIVPVSVPKTKPKACNAGLEQAAGEYTVIYDAEDVPESDQLKKAYLVFQKLAGSRVVCAQAKLDFYNVRQNVLTRLFAIEYAVWFDLILTGLQSAGGPIPLGGTSNHFRTADLRRLGGWDAYNVTEDCDLGMRISKAGQETVVFNSTTFEEANSRWGNWLRQRSRWIKGYIQTYCVHMRHPGAFFSWRRPLAFFTFQLIVGGKIFALFANPFFWCLTLAYILFRPSIGAAIESFYPAPVLYAGIFSLAFGNFLYLYYHVLGCLKRRNFELVKYAALVPGYWLMMSLAAWKALYQLVANPHYWEKTLHGLHIGEHPSPQIPVYEVPRE